MQLLNVKYGETESLKRASFDLLRAKFSSLSPDAYLTLVPEIETALQLPGDVPPESDFYFLQGQVWDAIPGKKIEACFAYLLGASTCVESDIQEFLQEANKNLTVDNAIPLFSKVKDLLVEKIIKRSNNNQQLELIYGILGRFYLYHKNVETATEYFNKIHSISPHSVLATEGLGQIYLLQGKAEQASECFLEARSYTTSIDQKSEVTILLIKAWMQSRNYDAAIIEIGKAQSLTANSFIHAQLNILLSECYYAKKEFNTGLSIIDNVLGDSAITSDGTKVFFVQAISIKSRLHIALHEYQKALKALEDALHMEQRNTELIFLKAQIFIEGQFQIEEGKNLISYLFKRNLIDFDSKINEELALRHEDGNAYFFAAYIKYLTHPLSEIVAAYVEKADKLGLTNENIYTKTELYLLKGEIGLIHKDNETAGKEFFSAGKDFYWQAKYSEANSYFKKVIQLIPAFHEAYIYCADTQFLLSYQNDPPYNNESLIQEAYNTWHASPLKIVTSVYDAWFYIVIARIHEVNYKFTETNFLEEYWQCILYAERALIHDPDFYSYWVNLGRYYRNLDLEYNSLNALNYAESLKADDESLKEEKTMTLLNIGQYDEPLKYLSDRKTRGDDYKSYLKSWEAYALYHQDKETEAISLYEENIREAPSDLYAHQMKMIVHWFLHQMDEARKEAQEILRLENYKLYPKEEFTFSWAYFILGNPDTAIRLLEDFNQRDKLNSDNSFSLCQFYLYVGDTQKGKQSFDLFIKWTTNPRALSDLSKRLTVLEYHYKQDTTKTKEATKTFIKILKEWQKQIEDKMEEVTRNPISPPEELASKQKEFNYSPGSIPHVVIQAGLARHYRSTQDFPAAYKLYKALAPYDSLFPEGSIAIQKIEDEVYNKAFALIKESKFTEAVDYLEKFLVEGILNTPKANMLLSLAYFGSSNLLRALLYLKASFNSPLSDTYYQQIWSDLIDKAYLPQWTWGFGNFIQSNIEHFNIADKKTFQTQMADHFWNVLINKESDLYPVVTPIALEMSNDLVPEEAFSDQWYVITKLIPHMRQGVEQNYGVKPPGVRIRGNDGDLGPGAYIIMLDEIPLVMGSVQAGKLYVDKSSQELQALGISGEPATSFIPGEKVTWVNGDEKEKLNQNHIQYQEDYFRVIMGHLSYLLSYSLDLFIDTQFCEYYLDLSGYEMKNPDEKKVLLEKAEEIKISPTWLLLLNEVLKGLVHEQVPILNKEIILSSFLEAVKNKTEATDILQLMRIALKNELPLNKTKLKSFELPVEVEKKIKDELRTVQGKTFLAMTPENCQEALAEVRNIVSNDPSPGNLLLLTKDSKLRVHLRKLVELEFPNLMVASQEELIDV